MTKNRDDELVVEIKSGSGHLFDAIWNGTLSECRSCGEEIGFAKTKKGKWVPFDPPETDGEPAIPHWSSCAKAEEFRR